ncbi:signal peptide, CUB and EGF-like domain-containing protein 1 isoform X2 [Scylla paramamosain]|uniref:signal peptide, CUB and EGF-like domain-containing protein 1 isoform X2 n=1 Tax=Scylla paramamosain TaxID=85552 RepID=UPI0030835A6C
MQLRWTCASLLPLLLMLLMLLLQVAGVKQGCSTSSTSLQRWERSPAYNSGFHAPSRPSKTRRYSRRDRRRRPDSCRSGRHRCHRHAVCRSFHRHHRCVCRDGWEGNGRSCRDLDECQVHNGGCVHVCTNTPGNYTCSCYPGFLPDVHDPHNCQDVDECALHNGGCQHFCRNTLGSFACFCPDGLTLASDGRTCSVATASCTSLSCEHHCLPGPGGAPSCGCREGYVLVRGKFCKPTCAVGNGGCQHHCHESTSGSTCTCHAQYLLAADGQSCTPSCAIRNGGCDRRCHNTATGVRCSCPRGFQLHHDHRTCLDVDECTEDSGGCQHRCVNNWGSYECLCPDGHKLLPDERTCVDVDECAVKGTCEHLCTNTLGSYTCSCREGFQLFAGAHCGDINECSINNGGCSHLCVNTRGSHRCECRAGHRLHPNGKDCLSNDQCSPLRSPAKAEVSCYHLEDYGHEGWCTVKCRRGAAFTSGNSDTNIDNDYHVMTCGPDTAFTWRSEANSTYLACSEGRAEMGYKQAVRLLVAARYSKRVSLDQLLEELAQVLAGWMKPCGDKCRLRVTSGKITKSKKLRKRHKVTRDQHLVRIKFEVLAFPPGGRRQCGRGCGRQAAERLLTKILRPLRRNIAQNQQLSSSSSGRLQYRLLPATYQVGKRLKAACPDGFVPVAGKCVACSSGSQHDLRTDRCLLCPSGTYQPGEAATKCLACPAQPSTPRPMQRTGARNLSECADACPAGWWSADGYSPCQQCAAGTYQAEKGRVQCSLCPSGHASPPGATSLEQCLTNRHRCGGHVGALSGVFETPNYPGHYPDGARCTWVVPPKKGRRVLVVVPSVRLSHDQCGDYLVMRKSKSPYSTVTFETCSTLDRPIVFTSRSQRLWVHFRSDAAKSDKGFRILYATYNKEYHRLIKNIVRDDRLYSLHNHQNILKDRELLPRLLEVVAEPIKYYEYANEKDKLFPSSFIKLLTPKVRRFFSRRRRRK